MIEFSPVSGLVGGCLIGLAAVFLMATTGRIAGISGMVEGILEPGGSGFGWKAAFIAGLIAAPFAYALVSGHMPTVAFPHRLGLMIAGGLLVGFGARLSGGCTSGHGVCGMSRLSKRSIFATLLFMAAGFVTVLVVHLAGGVR